VAIEQLDSGIGDDEKAFYRGKIAAASFFAKNFLPMLNSTRQINDNLDNDVMDLDEAGF
jgi:hypothetical protein